jgi:hypothetical protein
VRIRIIAKKIEGGDFFVLIKKLEREGRDIEVYQDQTFHDRFIRIDDVWWHLGHSIKDLGSADAVMTKLSEPAIIKKLREREEEVYHKNRPIRSY